MRGRVIRRWSVVTALVATIALANAAPALAITISGTLDVTDPFYSPVGASGSTCVAAPVAGAPILAPFPYDTYSFTNTSASAQCVTVSVTAAGGPLFIHAYAGGSNYVGAPATGLIGSEAACLSAGASFQFSVPAGQTFLLVVSPCTGGLPRTYTVEVTGTGITGGTQVAAVLRGAPAAIAGAKGVTVRWRTASEVDLLGFNVYRQVDGRRLRVNARLIAAHGAGAYAFLDRRAPRARPLRYWLQAVNLDGSRRWYGPARLARGVASRTRNGG